MARGIAQRDELISTVVDESERLYRFIVNLLDMTKIESGVMEPNSSLHYAGDIAGSALRRANKVLEDHRTEMNVPEDLPMVYVDPVLLEQVFFNLLDNASKYTPGGSTISIEGCADTHQVVIRISDEGPGIQSADLDRIFDIFHRAHGHDHPRAGTGLGLSICRGFIEAMGGTIFAGNRTDRSGAIFTIQLRNPKKFQNWMKI